MRDASARPIWLVSPKVECQRMDSINTGTKELNDINAKVLSTWPFSKKATNTENCEDKFKCNICQKVIGTLPEITTASGNNK